MPPRVQQIMPQPTGVDGGPVTANRPGTIEDEGRPRVASPSALAVV